MLRVPCHTIDVVWRFSPKVAADARQFLFHPTQAFEDRPDGSIIQPSEPGQSPCPMMMSWESGRILQTKLRDRDNRRLIDIVATDDTMSTDGRSAQSAISWTASNSALIDKQHPNGSQTFSWEDMRQHEVRPLDVDNFNPQFTVSVSAADMVKLYRERLEKWRGIVDSKKPGKLMTLSFRDASMTYKVDGDEDLTAPCEGTIPVPVTLQFRSRDLLELVLKLNEQHTQTFDVSGDDGGLLCVSWSDHLGSYGVYMPTSHKDEQISGADYAGCTSSSFVNNSVTGDYL